MMKLHAQYMFICILCGFCSNWYKLVFLLLIVMNSCSNEVVIELDMLLLLICTMGIPFVKLLFELVKFVLSCSCEGPKRTFVT